MGAAHKIEPRYTAEQYLEYERRADFKSEYLDGQIYAMAGGSPNHSLVAANCIASPVVALRGKPCTVYTSDLKVRGGSGRFFGYPDVTVVCGERRYHDEHHDVVTNPIVIIEVLSPSTETADRGVRWQRFQAIESLQAYVLVAQNVPRVEHYQKEADGSWRYALLNDVQAHLPLRSLECILPLAEIYANVEFSGEEEVDPGAHPLD